MRTVWRTTGGKGFPHFDHEHWKSGKGIKRFVDWKSDNDHYLKNFRWASENKETQIGPRACTRNQFYASILSCLRVSKSPISRKEAETIKGGQSILVQGGTLEKEKWNVFYQTYLCFRWISMSEAMIGVLGSIAHLRGYICIRSHWPLHGLD